MAPKVATLDKVFTRQELARMDPQIVARIQTGLEAAIVASGAEHVNPTMVKANFAALKAELLSAKVAPLVPKFSGTAAKKKYKKTK